MESAWTRPIALSRAPWLRAADGVEDAARSLGVSLRAAWLRWQASRRRAAEWRALRQLSPSVLRDIGAGPEWEQAIQDWRERHDAARDSFLRGL